MSASFWETGGTYLAVLTPLVAVPLTVLTFYLRSLQEGQASWRMEFTRRIESLEAATAEGRKMMANFERDYATKEEWLRECMQARRQFEHLTQCVTRLEVLLGEANGQQAISGSGV